MNNTNGATAQQQLSSTDIKIPRERSAAYPSYDIPHSFELTETIFKLFGNSIFIPREKISEKTGIGDSQLQMQLSSCAQYKLIEMRSKEGYKASSLFIQLYKPKSNEDIKALRLQVFNSPELYKKIIEEHNNETFTEESLATLLYRDYNIKEKASLIAAKIFIENARYLNVINEDNLFNISDSNNIQEIEIIDDKPKDDKKHFEEVKYLPPAAEENKGNKSFNHPPIPVFVDDDGSVAEVYLPHGFNKKHIERIIKVLQAQIT